MASPAGGASAAVQRAVLTTATALGHQLARHSSAQLAQEVFRSASAWANPSMRRALAAALGAAAAAAAAPPAAEQQLTGDKLDGAFATLKLLSGQLAALSGMPASPCSTSSSQPGVTISAKSWLVPRSRPAHHWQFCYELRFTNHSQEPLKLLRKELVVCELSGAQRSRCSEGLLGLQPVIECGASVAFTTAVCLNSIKGAMRGEFFLQGVDSGRVFPARMAAFALTAAQQQQQQAPLLAAAAPAAR